MAGRRFGILNCEDAEKWKGVEKVRVWTGPGAMIMFVDLLCVCKQDREFGICTCLLALDVL